MKLWEAFLASPVEFIGGIVILGGAIAGFILWVLAEQLKLLKERISARDEQIAALERQIAAVEGASDRSPLAPATSTGKAPADPKARTFLNAIEGGEIGARNAEIDPAAGAMFSSGFAVSKGPGSLIDFSGSKIISQPGPPDPEDGKS